MEENIIPVKSAEKQKVPMELCTIPKRAIAIIKVHPAAGLPGLFVW